jgi:hypothetical protein
VLLLYHEYFMTWLGQDLTVLRSADIVVAAVVYEA